MEIDDDEEEDEVDRDKLVEVHNATVKSADSNLVEPSRVVDETSSEANKSIVEDLFDTIAIGGTHVTVRRQNSLFEETGDQTADQDSTISDLEEYTDDECDEFRPKKAGIKVYGLPRKAGIQQEIIDIIDLRHSSQEHAGSHSYFSQLTTDTCRSLVFIMTYLSVTAYDHGSLDFGCASYGGLAYREPLANSSETSPKFISEQNLALYWLDDFCNGIRNRPPGNLRCDSQSARIRNRNLLASELKKDNSNGISWRIVKKCKPDRLLRVFEKSDTEVRKLELPNEAMELRAFSSTEVEGKVFVRNKHSLVLTDMLSKKSRSPRLRLRRCPGSFCHVNSLDVQLETILLTTTRKHLLIDRRMTNRAILIMSHAEIDGSDYCLTPADSFRDPETGGQVYSLYALSQVKRPALSHWSFMFHKKECLWSSVGAKYDLDSPGLDIPVFINSHAGIPPLPNLPLPVYTRAISYQTLPRQYDTRSILFRQMDGGEIWYESILFDASSNPNKSVKRGQLDGQDYRSPDQLMLKKQSVS
uniref:Uncharacterized protein n=1 Tax=Ditylenchus dipsaci TaxID=166011 RepID=A0A915D019_9BILA